MSDGPAALAALAPNALVADAAALVRVPSVTGDERAALETLCGLAERLGLEASLVRFDLDAVRAHPGHPGEEAPRTELLGAEIRLPRGGAAGATRGRSGDLPRLALCCHVDVVPEGTVEWGRGGPWSGAVDDGRLYGRGSADMKGGTVAALHALAALQAAGAEPGCDPVLLAVGSEEDGGLGAFAALERDADWAACVIPEPTGFDVVCAQAGAITFSGTVHGVAAHAAHRLEGVSAIDRYVELHQALADLERELNTDVTHPLMAALELPYPISIGRISAGDWASTVPDRLDFEGRAPVRLGESIETAQARCQARALRARATTGCQARALHTRPEPPSEVRLQWQGGAFAPAETDPESPVARCVRAAVTVELGTEAKVAGVPWGADMRLFTARGIPTVMVGAHGIERAHGVDEWVSIDDLTRLARVLIRVVASFGDDVGK